MISRHILFLSGVLFFLHGVSVGGSEIESLLIRTLLKDYDPLSRPVENVSDAVNLTFGIRLSRIIEINEKQQSITLNVLLKYSWADSKLKWDPKKYQNITVLKIPPRFLWRPDFRLYNMAEEHTGESSDNTNIVAFSGGSVRHVPPAVIKSTCRMDVTWFPFDKQICTLKFGSWTFSGLELDVHLSNDTEPLADYVESGEWQLLSFIGERTVKYYDCCSEPYVGVQFTLQLRRRSLYYFFNLLVPCALIGFLALLGFTLPPDSGEKLPLGVTVLFSLIVFLNMIAQSMPANSDAVPLLGTYFNCVMFMIASSVVSTVVINLNQKAMNVKEIQQGRWRQLFFHWLPIALRMTPPTPTMLLFDMTVDINQSQRQRIKESKVDSMKYILGHSQDRKTLKEREESAKLEWKFVAIVVDRICLIFSMFFTIVATLVLLISAL